MTFFTLLLLCGLPGCISSCSSDVSGNSTTDMASGKTDSTTRYQNNSDIITAASGASSNTAPGKGLSGLNKDLIIGGSVAAAVVLLIIITMVTTVLCCCRRKKTSASVTIEGQAFSNVTYGLFVGEEVEVEVGKDGLPVDGVPLNNATRADQVLHTQGIIAGSYLERPRSYSTSITQESQDASVPTNPQESHELVSHTRPNHVTQSSSFVTQYETIDHRKVNQDVLVSPYEEPVASFKTDTEEAHTPSSAALPGTLYREPATNEESLYHQLQQLDKDQSSTTTVVLGKYIGCGQFGEVYKGVWISSEGTLDAAIKTLKEDASTEDKVRFLQEAAIMGQFQHPNVVTMYGVVSKDDKILIAMELLQQGNLQVHLRSWRDREVDCSMLLGYCRQIACGMEYLSGRGFIHRDLAARNVLLTTAAICKIADFGMSRDLLEGSYYISHGGKIPVKWSAPEALSYQKYSAASDVWSYGAVLYEIWSLGRKPFEGIDNLQIISLLESGYRLAPPPGCSRLIYKVMIACWHPISKKRPTFDYLVKVLSLPEDDLLAWAEADTPHYSQPLRVGASLSFGQVLYKDLQNRYTNEDGLEDSVHEQVAFVLFDTAAT